MNFNRETSYLWISAYQNFLIPEIPNMCDLILVTPLKMWPHYSQSSRENATSPNGTAPSASYKEVPPSRDSSDETLGHES